MPNAAQCSVQHDPAGQVVFVEKLLIGHGVGLLMELRAEGEGFQPLVEDVGPIPAHAHPVHVVELGGPSRNAALLSDKTGVDVILYVVHEV